MNDHKKVVDIAALPRIGECGMTTDTTISAPTPPPPRKRKQTTSTGTSKLAKRSTVLSLSDKYKIAYTDVWTKLPKWKRVAIKDDQKKGIEDSRFVKEFIQAVERQAETT